jgi:hypothetical protein
VVLGRKVTGKVTDFQGNLDLQGNAEDWRRARVGMTAEPNGAIVTEKWRVGAAIIVQLLGKVAPKPEDFQNKGD